MTFADLFRSSHSRRARTSCPFCPGPAAAETSASLCNVCRRHLGLEVAP